MADLATVSVRRQVLEVELRGTQDDGIALQRRLPELCSRVLGPALEAAFADFDQGDADVCVERLDVDLGRISLTAFDDELGAALRAAIEDFLRNRPSAFRPTDASVAATGPATENVRRRTSNEIVDEALLLFLRTGRLPWAFQLPAGEQLEQVVRRAWSPTGVSRGPPGAVTGQLREVLREPNARARLVIQFSAEFAAIVLSNVSPSGASTLEACVAALRRPDHPTAESRRFTQQLWDVALVAAAADRNLDQREMVATAWHRLPVDHRRASLRATLERLWPGVTRAEVGADDGPSRDGQGVGVEAPSTSGGDVRRDLSAGQRSPTGSTPSDVEHDVDGLLVDNAGLVLLHPFLPRFFEGLGVARGDELVDPGRGLCLLHHLATGELVAPEHELMLAKVLCDVALDEPVEADVGITDDEREEAIALLESAIGHWGALRNSSPDALRGEFLMRPGMLSVDVDGGWLLRVEARTIDVLLDQLPWGVSMIRLPWMHRMLRVEWR